MALRIQIEIFPRYLQVEWSHSSKSIKNSSEKTVKGLDIIRNHHVPCPHNPNRIWNIPRWDNVYESEDYRRRPHLQDLYSVFQLVRLQWMKMEKVLQMQIPIKLMLCWSLLLSFYNFAPQTQNTKTISGCNQSEWEQKRRFRNKLYISIRITNTWQASVWAASPLLSYWA